MINRRGLPEEIISDNGTNFVAADKELKEMTCQIVNDSKFTSTMIKRKIKWFFNPPQAPVDSHDDNGMYIYNKFLETVEEFCSLNALPVDVKFEELFYQNRAKWHKSCCLKFSASELAHRKQKH